MGRTSSWLDSVRGRPTLSSQGSRHGLRGPPHQMRGTVQGRKEAVPGAQLLQLLACLGNPLWQWCAQG